MRLGTATLGILLCAAAAARSAAADISPADRSFFETRIRPVLVEQCYECHSPDSEKLGGKLLLDTRSGMLEGGESGAALRAGKPAESLLIHALRWENDLEMPPEEPLPAAIVNDFVRWIEMGAPDPRDGKTAEVAGRSYEPGDLWYFSPVTQPAPPEVSDPAWSQTPVDRFVFSRLQEMGLQPAPPAAPETLLRRLYFDLVGLPPNRQAMEAFVADYQAHGQPAVARVVDELLASPGFGERWGRHWLDVARYAESNGNDGLGRNPTFPHAWRFRDYVIEAFRRDTPYDRFLTEQIAGDLLPAETPEERDRHRIATGFLALGAKPAKAMNNNFDMDVVADQIDAIGSGILGLSVACARCHDHKFDPIPTRDYYALAGIFSSTETMWGVAAHEKLTAPPTDLHLLEAAATVPPPAGFVETVVLLESDTGKPKPIPKSKWEPGAPLAMGVRDKEKPGDIQINLKGDAKQLGETVPRGFLTACETGGGIAVDPGQSGRLQLAQWLTTGEHPQTARVMVNRIWQHLFGRGIVATPDDFGVYGDRPTHPELLDYLAASFVEEGWSVKRAIRAIVLTHTYQLDSDAPAATLRDDPENLWLARHSRRRLDAESLRDAILTVSGQLEATPPGGSLIRHRDILVNLAGSLHQPTNHRSVYLCYLRDSPPPELAAFDLPSFTKVTGRRDVSTVPGQALFLYNNPFVIDQSDRFAATLLAAPIADDPSRVRHAFLRALNREPDPEELYRALEMVEAVDTRLRSRERAWSSLCQALLATNEFRYID